MKHFVVICCVLASATAKQQKISLEDIERDNLKSTQTPLKVPPRPVASPTRFGFGPVKTVADYARQPVPQQQYTQQYAQYQPQQYYYQQPNYPQYENVQYITDNHIAAQQQQQQYYPQYVYYQQYTAPSTAIQTVVDPKGGIQYVMYIPSYATPKAEQTENYENVVYAAAPAPAPQTYVAPSEPQTQYVQQTQVVEQVPEFSGFVKKQPKSLLDSYIPSVLQVQYYKQQQQAQANAIQQNLKDVGQVSGKTDYVKGYRPEQRNAETVVNYQYQTPN